jgi:hypothetical protein
MTTQQRQTRPTPRRRPVNRLGTRRSRVTPATLEQRLRLGRLGGVTFVMMALPGEKDEESGGGG